ncbi:hypothetical protein [Sphingosinicella sp. CPCC 101087]|uniref:hypothetical protein n=1 Tax=Sphingosinicella sp. CPCC 101087 TaxID=2497754 RepID=UPI001981A5DD|nr:hypothetical protein [Sphingosinicella sp. CPCC 101087]
MPRLLVPARPREKPAVAVAVAVAAPVWTRPAAGRPLAAGLVRPAVPVGAP